MSRGAYLVAAWGIVVAVVAQVSLIGLWMFSGQPTLSLHKEFGHAITLAVGALLVFAFTGRLPKRMKLTTALLFAIMLVQTEVFAFIPGSPTRAFHTVLPLVIFSLAVFLAFTARRFVMGQPAGSALPRHVVEVSRTESLASKEP